VRGKGGNEYEGFPLSNSGLTDALCPAFTHWKRRGTKKGNRRAKRSLAAPRKNCFCEVEG